AMAAHPDRKMLASHTRLLIAVTGEELPAVSASAVTIMTSRVGSHCDIWLKPEPHPACAPRGAPQRPSPATSQQDDKAARCCDPAAMQLRCWAHCWLPVYSNGSVAVIAIPKPASPT